MNNMDIYKCYNIYYWHWGDFWCLYTHWGQILPPGVQTAELQQRALIMTRSLLDKT